MSTNYNYTIFCIGRSFFYGTDGSEVNKECLYFDSNDFLLAQNPKETCPKPSNEYIF